MGLVPTLSILAIALGIAGFARWKANRPYEPGASGYINWTLVMILAGTAAFLMVVHLFSLAGIEVGQGRPR